MKKGVGRGRLEWCVEKIVMWNSSGKKEESQK